MVRTQLQIDEKTYEAIRLRAHLERKSISAVVREILSEALGRENRGPRGTTSFSFIGSGASGPNDISERHDEALAEDFK
jgi:hypothetical protein